MLHVDPLKQFSNAFKTTLQRIEWKESEDEKEKVQKKTTSEVRTWFQVKKYKWAKYVAATHPIKPTSELIEARVSTATHLDWELFSS